MVLQGENLNRAMEKLAQKRKDGGDLSFRQFLAQEYKYSVEKLFSELKINPMRTSVRQMIELDESNRIIFPELIRDALIVGMEKAPIYDKLIAATEEYSQQSYAMPFIDVSKMRNMKGKLQTVKGATPRELGWEVITKVVRTKPIKTVLRVPYSSIRQSSINLLPTHFAGAASRFQGDVNTLAFNCLMNGDGGTNLETDEPVDSSPAVIGVESTTNGITEDDYTGACIRYSTIRIPVTSFIASPSLQKKAVKWDEFKLRRQGTADTRLNFEFPLPAQLDSFPTNEVSENKLLLLSKPFAMIKMVSQGIMIESDKDIIRSLHEAAVTFEVGFANTYRNGRVVIDGTKELASNDFPAWFDYAN